MRIRALPAAILAGAALLSVEPSASADDQAALLAATAGGHLVEVSAATGRIERIVAGSEVTGGKVGGIAVGGPTGDEVFFARHDPGVGLPCDATISRLPLAGGRAETVGRGFAPAVSPDGEWLAYVGASPAGNWCTFAVHARPFAGGEERTWPLDGQWKDYYGICAVAWSPSGRQLVVEVCSEGDSVLHVLSLDSGGTVGDATFAGPRAGSTSWATPASIATGAGEQVAVIERCCATGDPTRPDQQVRVLDVAGAGVSSGGGLAPVPAGAGWVRSLDVAADGRAAVVAGGRGRLLVARGGELVPIGEGFISARWLPASRVASQV